MFGAQTWYVRKLPWLIGHIRFVTMFAQSQNFRVVVLEHKHDNVHLWQLFSNTTLYTVRLHLLWCLHDCALSNRQALTNRTNDAYPTFRFRSMITVGFALRAVRCQITINKIYWKKHIVSSQDAAAAPLPGYHDRVLDQVTSGGTATYWSDNYGWLWFRVCFHSFDSHTRIEHNAYVMYWFGLH